MKITGLTKEEMQLIVRALNEKSMEMCDDGDDNNPVALELDKIVRKIKNSIGAI